MSLQSLIARVKLWDGTNQASVSASNALKVDGSAVTQPISAASLPSHAVTNAGTFATQATQSGTWTVQPGNTANTTAWKVDGSAVTQPVSVASVPSHAVTNAGTFAVQATEADGANTTLGAKADAKSTATDVTAISVMSVLKQISASVQAPPSQAVTNAGTFAAQVAQSGTWTVQPGNTANTTAWKVDGSAVTQPVSGTVTANIGTGSLAGITAVVHVDDNAGSLTVDGSVTAVPDKSATSTLSNVASSATSVTLLASNANRKGATIYNDSTQVLYVKFGTTASATSFNVAMVAASYYEVPFQHTGRIDGIWASANGNARVGEFT